MLRDNLGKVIMNNRPIKVIAYLEVKDIVCRKILDHIPTKIRSLNWKKRDDFMVVTNVKIFLIDQLRASTNDKVIK